MNFCKHCNSCLSVDNAYQSSMPKQVTETNNPILDSEKPALRALLPGAISDLDAVDDQIRAVSQTLEALHRRREHIETVIGVCKGALTVVRELPTEVWAKIFMMLDDSKRVTLDPNSTPLWELARVCRIWRNASHLLPSWANVVTWTNWDYSIDTNSEILDSIFQINALCHRPVRLECRPETPSPLIDVAVAYSELWQHATLVLPARLWSTLAKLHNRIPLLQSFHLAGDADFSYPGPAYNLSIPFANAPSLTSLTISSPPTNFELSVSDFPWSQIEHLAFRDYRHSLDFEACRSVFSKMPRLISFKGWTMFDLPANSSPQSLRLHLRTLYLDRYCPEVLDFLDLPALTCIDLQFTRHGGYHFLNRVTALIDRSKCKIITFNSLYLSTWFTHTSLADFLQHVSNLKTFSIPSELSQDDLTLLGSIMESKILLPQLEEMTLHARFLSDFSWDAICDAVKKFLERPLPIKRLSFTSTFSLPWGFAHCYYDKLVEEFGDRIEFLHDQEEKSRTKKKGSTGPTPTTRD